MPTTRVQVRGTQAFGWCLTGHHGHCLVAINHGSDYDYKINACGCKCHSTEQIAEAVGAQEGAVAAALAAAEAKRPRKAEKAEKTPRRAEKTPRTGRECMCGCSETTGGGNYRPGHDSKHLTTLVGRLLEQTPLTPEAVEEAAQQLPSDALRAKLRRRVS